MPAGLAKLSQATIAMAEPDPLGETKPPHREATPGVDVFLPFWTPTTQLFASFSGAHFNEAHQRSFQACFSSVLFLLWFLSAASPFLAPADYVCFCLASIPYYRVTRTGLAVVKDIAMVGCLLG